MLRRFSPLFVLASALLFAQTEEATETVNKQFWAGELVLVGTIPGSGWQSTEAKTHQAGSMGPRLALPLLSTKEGHSRLKWDRPEVGITSLELHQAKAPANAQGSITMENAGTDVVLTQSTSVSLDDLKTHLALPPGYYAVRLRGNLGFTSDWMTIRIK
jgi:hypothetical protein